MATTKEEARDRLVSTGVIAQRLKDLEDEIADQRKVRPEGDPYFLITGWMIAEFRDAMKQAALEYRPTSEVAVLTGWDPQTLRAKARAVLAGQSPGPAWENLLVKADGGEYSFCLSTVPVKRTGELMRAG